LAISQVIVTEIRLTIIASLKPLKDILGK